MSDYYLFLDDIRNPNQVTCADIPRAEWVIVRNYKQFTTTIEALGMPKFISFDHDLADEHYDLTKRRYAEKTGMDCAKWLVEYCLDHETKMCEYSVHSMNTVGKENIESLLGSFKRA